MCSEAIAERSSRSKRKGLVIDCVTEGFAGNLPYGKKTKARARLEYLIQLRPSKKGPKCFSPLQGFSINVFGHHVGR